MEGTATPKTGACLSLGRVGAVCVRLWVVARKPGVCLISRSFFPFRSVDDPKHVGSYDPAFEVVSLWPCLKSLLSSELPFPAAAGCELLPRAQSHPQGLEAAELAH